ncbi:lytic transglycosylase domain-containing protein [Oecophyllibacter saccharovorans]|nr:lytic transglycosylase domain-containing protein [Oecophyllibacter saccharovorans]
MNDVTSSRSWRKTDSWTSSAASITPWARQACSMPTDYSPEQLDRAYEGAGKYWNVDPVLLRAVSHVEDPGGDPNARSRAGAIGPMQFMPATARTLGIDPTDSVQAIYGAARLLDENMRRYGNVADALRAYNAGTDRSRWANAETAAYPHKVAAAYHAFSTPPNAAKEAPMSTPQEQDFFTRDFGEEAGSPPTTPSSRDEHDFYMRDLGAADPVLHPEDTRPKYQQGTWYGNLGTGFVKGLRDVVDTPLYGADHLLNFAHDHPYLSLLPAWGVGLHVLGLNRFGDLHAPPRWNPLKAAVKYEDRADAQYNREYGDSNWAGVGRFAGNVAATAPIGGVVGGVAADGALAGARVLGMTGRAAALSSGLAGDAAGGAGSSLALASRDRDENMGQILGEGAALGAAAHVARPLFKKGLSFVRRGGNTLPGPGAPQAEAEMAKSAPTEAAHASRIAETDRALEEAHDAYQTALRQQEASAASASQLRNAAAHAATPQEQAQLSQQAAQAAAQHEAATEALKEASRTLDSAKDAGLETRKSPEAPTAPAPTPDPTSTPQEMVNSTRLSPMMRNKNLPQLQNDIIRTFGKGAPFQLVPAEIPGVQYTLAQHTGNTGLATLENTLRNTTPAFENAFKSREAANQAAIKNYWQDEVAGTPLHTDAASRNLNRYDQQHFGFDGDVFRGQQPVHALHLIEQAQKIAGDKAVPTHVADMVGQYVPVMQRALSTPEGEALPRDLYAARRTLHHDISAGTDANRRNLQEALPHLIPLRDQLDMAIARGAPAYPDALKDYMTQAQRLDEMRYLQNQPLETGTGAMMHTRVQALSDALHRDGIARNLRPDEAVSPETRTKLDKLANVTRQLSTTDLAQPLGTNTAKNLFANTPLTQRATGAAKLAKEAAFPLAPWVGRGIDYMTTRRTENLKSALEEGLHNKLLDPNQLDLNALLEKK